jgi:hypothetical protein
MPEKRGRRTTEIGSAQAAKERVLAGLRPMQHKRRSAANEAGPMGTREILTPVGLPG